jgi:low temperature requirement protein LtrA
VSEPFAEREQRVTPLELFFDLVFAFGFTQVTTVLSDDPTWHGLGHGVLILAALWWAWAAYAWLTNTVDPSDGPVWGALMVATATMFVAALAVPEVFGLHGVVFGVAFLIVTCLHLTLYGLAARDDRDLFGAVLHIVPTSLVCAGLILAAGFVHGDLKPLLWLAALVVGLIGPLLGDMGGWRLQPAHFIERHGLIVIIAIGESLVGIGVGTRHTALGAGVIAAAVLGLLVAASFWLAYFDFFPMRAQVLLAGRQGAERTALARDAYSYLHLPMVAGIVLFAFAMKTTLADVGDELATIPALCLCCGPALYLSSYVALRFRVSRTLGRGRFVAALACVALLPAALAVPAVVAVGLVAAVWIALHAYEIIWWREERARARAQRVPASAS